ncbi:WD40 repeat domain-containing protein [Streptomyces acidicola]|uniref:WD40 repeat domain-containing protein n=1 Tax=Streptomyces acidicola TaxID=2596892 RepID=UPI0037A48A16
MAAVDDSGRWAATSEYFTGGFRPVLLDLKNDRRLYSGKTGDSIQTIHKVVSVHGAPMILASTEKNVIYVPALPESAPTEPLINPALSPDGKSVVGLTDNGKRIERRASDEHGEVLAGTERPADDHNNWGAKVTFSADGKTVYDRVGKNTVVLRRASDLRPLRTINATDPPVTDPDAEGLEFSYARIGDSLVTVSGTVLQQWDWETGRQSARKDLSRLITGVSAKSTLSITRYPKPGHLAVVVWGDPKVRIVDTTTWRQVKTIRTGSHTAAIQFDPAGEYFVLNRRGGNIELWQSSPLRKRLGPIFTSDVNRRLFVPWFLRDGRFLLASHTSVNFYDVGKGRSEDAYTFGVPDDAPTGYSYLGASADGRTILFRDDGGLNTEYRTIQLDAALWSRQLCRVTGYREFTTTERESLGIAIPGAPLCQG